LCPTNRLLLCSCLCCACTCCSCDFPTCCGCRAGGTTLCIENYCVCCKPVDDPQACCLLMAFDNELVVPNTCCRRYDQCCCCEIFCSIPFDEGSFHKSQTQAIDMKRKEDGTKPSEDVTICWYDPCITRRISMVVTKPLF
jgi:hypothetical protein